VEELLSGLKAFGLLAVVVLSIHWVIIPNREKWMNSLRDNPTPMLLGFISVLLALIVWRVW
jgi:hypothetical protein